MEHRSRFFFAFRLLSSDSRSATTAFIDLVIRTESFEDVQNELVVDSSSRLLTAAHASADGDIHEQGNTTGDTCKT